MRDRPIGIVAGIDGSQTSLAAARWALEEARRRHVALTLVNVWASGLDTAYPPYDDLGVDALEGHARRMVAAVADQLGSGCSEDIPINAVVVEGTPGPALVEQAADAELLVVGTRGHGPVLRAVLGSVSTYCAHHARCSTVVVPAPPVRSPPAAAVTTRV